MKIRSQLDIKRKMGEFIGAFATYGYKKDPKNKNHLVVDEDAAKVVELIFRLRLQGMSNSRIASKLNGMGIASPMEYKRSQGQKYESGFRAMWNAVSVRRVLTNETYLGTLIQHKRGTPNYKVKKEIQYDREDWIVIEENHDPIIEETDFQTVQSLLQRDVRVAPDKESTHLFAGFVYCGDCEHCMTRKAVPSHGKKYYYFICSTYKAHEGCSSHSFSEAKLNRIVFGLVQDQIQLVAEVDHILDYIASLPEHQRSIFNYDAQITKLEAEIERYKNLKLNLYSDMSDGVISREEYMEFRAGYDRKIASCQQSLGKITEERRQAVDNNDRHSGWIEIFRQYRNITELHREVIVNLIERIVIYDSNRIEIVFRYQDELQSALQYIDRFSEILPKESKEA
ncbi:MAG: recombinase family protein [Lachnospiraceae bacterium]|nr:recombinase family protein [Lachnospiraceae bacterium]